MKLSEISINQRVMTFMGVLALVIMGAVTIFRIPLNLMPEVEFPFVMVKTILPGAAPDVVEADVTDKVEEAVSEVAGIKNLDSTSLESLSFIFIEFELGQNVSDKAQEVRDKIAMIRRALPQDTEDPEVSKFDINASPVMAVLVSGSMPVASLTEYCERTLKSQFQAVQGVGRVDVIGGRKREVRVWLDPALLDAKGLAVTDVEGALRGGHIEMAGGRIVAGGTEYIIKIKGEVATVAAFEDIPVAYRGGNPVRLREVGRVDDSLEEERTASRMNGRTAVALQVYRQSGANIVELARKIKERIRETNALLPEGINRLVVTQDLSLFTENSLTQTRDDLLMGGVLAVLIVFLFLVEWRTTVIVAAVIPTTIISSFYFIWWLGFSFNILTLMAYTISVGMLIDDAIVMTEVIFRHLKRGLTPLEAARTGAAEVGFAVVATSLAIVAVFMPVAFTKGIVGQFLMQFGVTVSIAVVISTVFALTFTPAFAAVFLQPFKPRRSLLGRVVDGAFDWFADRYRRALAWSITHRAVVVALSILLFAGSILMAMFGVETEFEPRMDRGEITVAITLPLGTPMEKTMEVTAGIDAVIGTVPGVIERFSTVGAGGYGKVNQSSVYVKLAAKNERTMTQFEFQDTLRTRINAQFPGVELVIGEFDPGGDLKGAAIQFALRGPDFDRLQKLAGEIMAEMAATPGFIEIDSSYETGQPEVPLFIDREAAAREGVPVASIAMAVNSLVGGVDILTYKELGRQYDVRLRLPGTARGRIADIYDLSVRSQTTGGLVKLRNLLKPVTSGTGVAEISRGKRQRQIVIGANLDDKMLVLGTAMKMTRAMLLGRGIPIAGDKNKGLDETKRLKGYSAQFVGMAEIMTESFASLSQALVIGIIFIYMLLASLYNKLMPPFAIMFSLPLSIVGIFGAMMLAGENMNIMAMISIIMLMSLVVKNAILLIDYAEHARAGGQGRHDAIVEAGGMRLKPIMMTALSTIVGMLPAAISTAEGSEMRRTMAVCVIGGLVTSTFLTLLVVPVAYSLLDDLTAMRWFRITMRIVLGLASLLVVAFIVAQYLLEINVAGLMGM
ncbi:MAG: efflux RND transporter permease subunit [Planctomycetota bacterium]